MESIEDEKGMTLMEMIEYLREMRKENRGGETRFDALAMAEIVRGLEKLRDEEMGKKEWRK
jgi:hypothetical protein